MAETLVAESNGLEAVSAPSTEPLANGHSGEEPEKGEQQQPEPVSKGLYIVRVPRPYFDDSAIKALDEKLGGVFGKLKAVNAKAQVKRGEANELRKQLGVARSLRNGSNPEFDEKMTRIKQLRDMRKVLLDKIQDIKTTRNTLECKTEEELDERINEMEHSIQHDGLSLTEEKQYVHKISKLRTQREAVRTFQVQAEGLAALEAESRKIKAVIDEVDSEMNILRGERDQAKDIIDDLVKKLQAVTAVLTEYDGERGELEQSKREIQDKMRKLREGVDGAMLEYRANRKLSLDLRDLVDAGKLEEAARLAEQQLDDYHAKLADAKYRKEYCKLWSEQRRYAVSELLPESGDARAAGGPGGGGARGGPGGARGDPRSSEYLKPQGAAKAQAIIAAALQEASDLIAARRAAEPPRPEPVRPEPEDEPEAGEGSEGEAAEPAAPAVRIVPGADDEWVSAPTKAPKAHRAGAFEFARQMAEVPDVPDYEYLMPPVQATKEELTADELKARVREEQRQKAAEAAERKKRRQEALQRKAEAAKEAAKSKAAELAAAAKEAAHQARAAAERASRRSEEVQPASGSESDGKPSGGGATQRSVLHQKVATNRHLPAKAHHQLAAATASTKLAVKKPVKPQRFVQQYTAELALAGVALIFVLVLAMSLVGGR